MGLTEAYMKDQIIKILLLEDDPAISRQVEPLLRQQPYELVVTGSAGSAIAHAIQVMPDLIVCDMQLQHISSHQFLIEVRNNMHLNHIPFIFINGKTGWDHARFAMNLGADDYLPTPFNQQNLLMSIKARLSRFKNIADFGGQATAQEPPRVEIPAEVADKLSKTEFRIYRMISNGLTAQEISKELSISMKTLENHRYNIAKKLNISGHYGLLHYVIKDQVKRHKR